MSNVKHTPGPWRIAPKSCKYRCCPDEATSAKMEMLGVPFEFEALSVGTNSGSAAIIPLDESNEANARLISAAPELLDACKLVVNQSKDQADPYGVWLENAMDVARAAIAKAEGK